jgi:hypothetical protein
LVKLLVKLDIDHWIGLRENLNRKPWFLPLNMGGSCKFSLKPIQWIDEPPKNEWGLDVLKWEGFSSMLVNILKKLYGVTKLDELDELNHIIVTVISVISSVPIYYNSSGLYLYTYRLPWGNQMWQWDIRFIGKTSSVIGRFSKFYYWWT